MKSVLLFLVVMLLYGQASSQKNATTLTSNLNLSKSNINRLVYPGNMVTSVNAQSLLADLEKANLPDEAAMKTWLAANFKRFGINPDLVKQIFIFSGRQYADCTDCKKTCKGRCVQDPGSDCMCVYHNPPSEPNLRTAQVEKPVSIIFLSTTMMDDAAAMEAVTNTFESVAKSTTVKSSKSNSQD